MNHNSEGLTESERYLSKLCKHTFLSLWSYTNVFRQVGSELCDLLVVCGNDIIIFSDKFCKYPNSGNQNLDWARWFNRAVEKSAKQLWGAEKWIKRDPKRIYLDSKCQEQLHVSIRITDQTKFHLVLVAHGASETCREAFGGSGSLMFDNQIFSLGDHKQPFVIGDLNSNLSFIHVLDDTTLDILLKNRDTISDFTNYLTKRAIFLRSKFMIISAGEEELLAIYLRELNEKNEHDFIFSDKGEKDGICLEEGIWEKFQKHPRRMAQIKADENSYFWDHLIEKFSKHTINKTQYYVSSGGFEDSEAAIRMLALQSRFSRRMLADSLIEIILNTPSDKRRLRINPVIDNRVYFIFLLLPFHKESNGADYDKYREERRVFLEASCFVTRLMYHDAKHVVGIAMESGVNPYGVSEDLLYFDCSSWNQELEMQARQDQKDFRILVSPQFFEKDVQEYPDA